MIAPACRVLAGLLSKDGLSTAGPASSLPLVGAVGMETGLRASQSAKLCVGEEGPEGTRGALPQAGQPGLGAPVTSLRMCLDPAGQA